MNLSSKTGYTNSVSLMVFHSVVGRGGRRKFQCDFGSKATCPIFSQSPPLEIMGDCVIKWRLWISFDYLFSGTVYD